MWFNSLAALTALIQSLWFQGIMRPSFAGRASGALFLLCHIFIIFLLYLLISQYSD